jgi:structure-specific endonuclease subunit SLX1
MSVVPYRFYGCYLLESLNPEAPKGKSYIGFTVDPVRRLRQHNGDLSRGGAKRTKSLRPWRIVCIINGFRSKVQGLQFEWTWQHPLLSRMVRGEVMFAKIKDCKLTSRGRQRECKVDSNLKILGIILSSSPWNMMPLTVTFFGSDTEQKIREIIPKSIGLEFRSDIQAFAESTGSENRFQGDHCEYECAFCESKYVGAQCRIVRCLDCQSSFHARCAASCFRSGGVSLIPSENGQCPVCGKLVLWSDFVRSAFIFNTEAIKSDQDSSSRSAETSSDTEQSIIDLEEEIDKRPQDLRSPIVESKLESSLRDRLFRKTGNTDFFEI